MSAKNAKRFLPAAGNTKERQMQMRNQTKPNGMPALRRLLVAVWILSVISVSVSAGGYQADNTTGNTLQVFPAAGSSDTEMAHNYGTIQVFYGNGHITENHGVIESSSGEVNLNYGTVRELSAGHMGTNFGTVETINNTGTLTVNDETGLVKMNLSAIERNYGAITANHGIVTMYDGTIEENGPLGTVVFEGSASRGTIKANAGSVTIHGSTGKITITSNTGSITVNGGTVVVEDNAGTITLGDKAALVCTNNIGTITTSEDAETYTSNCTNNFGEITFFQNSDGTFSSDRDYNKIEFSGDDGKAAVTGGGTAYQGGNYAAMGGVLTFTLPADYLCADPHATRDEAVPNGWRLNIPYEYGRTEYVVLCENAPHLHRFDYICSGNAVQAICTGEGDCPEGYKTAPLTLTLTANGGTYSGEAFAAFTDDSTVKFGEITGAAVGGIVYAAGTETLGSSAPVHAGSYTASVTVTYDTDRTVTVTKAFAIAKAPLTARANSYAGVTYGTEAPVYTVSYQGWVNGEDEETAPPTTAPVLTCDYTITSAAGTEYAITFVTAPVFANYAVTTENGTLKVVPANTVQEPIPADCTYNGMKQKGYSGSGLHVELAGTVAETNAGSYQFTAKPMDNYTWADGTTDTKTYDWKISKPAIAPAVTITGWTYGETANAPSVSGNDGNGTVTYSYKVKGTDDSTYSATVPTEAGEYTAKAVIAETDNYLGGSATVNFTIAEDNTPAPEPVVTVEGVVTEANVEGLDALRYMLEADATAVTLTVTEQDGTETDAPIIEAELSADQQARYLDITIVQTTGSGSVYVTEPDVTLAFTLDFDFTDVKLDSVKVLRVHNGIVDTLTTAPNTDGEYILVDAAAGTITIFANKFSTYAIVYELEGPDSDPGPSPTPGPDPDPEPDPYIPATYPVSGPESTENGKLTITSSSATAGEKVTLTAKPDEGYELDHITATDKNGNEIALTDLGNGKFSFKMPASKVTVAVGFKAAETEEPDKPETKPCPKDETCPLNRFGDTDVNAWYHDGIEYCLNNGLMKGISDSEFDPNGTTSRAMIVTILYRLEGEPAFMNDNIFSDVASGSWYEKAVVWASGKGIVLGYDDGTFQPDKAITREELAAILYRYAQMKGEGFVGASMFLMPFEDLSEISDWASESVRWCYMHHIILGRTETTFVPKATATRAEAAAMMQRFCQNLGK